MAEVYLTKMRLMLFRMSTFDLQKSQNLFRNVFRDLSFMKGKFQPSFVYKSIA